MTPDRMNLRIAVACGFHPVKREDWSHFCSVCGNHINDAVHIYPSYTTDLNAMHEAEKILSRKEGYFQLGGLGKYREALRDVEWDKEIFVAPANHRAEAFCRTVPCAECERSIWDCEQTECKGGVE